jgi:transmembrane sensor
MEESEFHRQLVRRYAENNATEAELEVFFHLLESGVLDKMLVAEMGLAPEDADIEALAAVVAGTPVTAMERPVGRGRVRRLWTKIAGVAAVLLLIGGGIWFWAGRNQKPTIELAIKTNIGPGGNKAVLTLANGRSIVLDSAANGLVAMQGTARVEKASGGLLYAPSSLGPGAAAPVLYNTLTTPRGGEYRLTLPDGSRVWLNAASSITYPTAFTGRDRRVSVTGEAYFDVAKDPAKVFSVQLRDSVVVDVLGTGFDVMAYGDEPEVKTTLIRGAVRVRKGLSATVLAPGEQADIPDGAGIAAGTGIQLLPGVDTAAVIAWVTGYFEFRNLTLAQLMRQIGRWYDVQIVNDAPHSSLTPKHFGGRVSRYYGLENLLNILGKLGVHLRVDGPTIHVLP